MVRVSSTRVSSARAPNSISGGSNTLCKGENGFATIPCRIRIAGRGPWIRYHPRQHDAIHNRSSSLSAERGVGPLRCFTVDHTRPLDQVLACLLQLSRRNQWLRLPATAAPPPARPTRGRTTGEHRVDAGEFVLASGRWPPHFGALIWWSFL